MTGNCHVRCGAGENSEITSKNYLSLFGKIPNFSETLAVVRSYNIRICTVVQGLSQLKAMYEKTWEGILSNCSIFTFLGTNDMESKEYVSKKLGKTTVKVDTRSYNRGSSHGGGGGSDSENYIQRDLLSPDEISKAVKAKGPTKKYGGSCIVFIDEFNPFYMPKFDTMSHKMFSQMGSSFPSGIPNNTYIEKTYADNKKIRHANHQQTLKNFFETSSEQKEKDEFDYAAEQEQKEIEEQERLKSTFDEDDFIDPNEENNEESFDKAMNDEAEMEEALSDENPLLDSVFPVEEDDDVIENFE